jgi:sugar lactone lactonase YvrE
MIGMVDNRASSCLRSPKAWRIRSKRMVYPLAALGVLAIAVLVAFAATLPGSGVTDGVVNLREFEAAMLNAVSPFFHDIFEDAGVSRKTIVTDSDLAAAAQVASLSADDIETLQRDVGIHNLMVLQQAVDATIAAGVRLGCTHLLYVPAGSYYFELDSNAAGRIDIDGDLVVQGDGPEVTRLKFGPEPLPRDAAGGIYAAFWIDDNAATYLQVPHDLALHVSSGSLSGIVWSNRGIAAARRANPSLAYGVLHPGVLTRGADPGEAVTDESLLPQATSGLLTVDCASAETWDCRERDLEDVLGIAVDPGEEYVYWIDPGNQEIDVGPSIRRCSLKDDNLPIDVVVGEEYLCDPKNLALDPVRGLLYWTDAGEPAISRVDVRDVSFPITGVVTVVTPDDWAGMTSPCGIAVDGDVIYWSDLGSVMDGVAPTILRATNVLGSGDVGVRIIAQDPRAETDTSHEYLPTLRYPESLALDTENSVLYWTDPGIPAIARLDLDGSSPRRQQIILGTTGIGDWLVETPTEVEMVHPQGITVDDRSGIYWVDSGIPAIMHADLDGTNARAIIENPAPINVAFRDIHLEGPDDPVAAAWESGTYTLAHSKLIFNDANSGSLTLQNCHLTGANEAVKVQRDIVLTLESCLLETSQGSIFMGIFDTIDVTIDGSNRKLLRPTSDAAACHLTNCTFRIVNPHRTYVRGSIGATPAHNVYLQRPHSFRAVGCLFADSPGDAIKWHGTVEELDELGDTVPASKYIQMSDCVFTGRGGAIVGSSSTKAVVSGCTFATGEHYPWMEGRHTISLYKAGIILRGCLFTGGSPDTLTASVRDIGVVEDGVLIEGCVFEEMTRKASITRYYSHPSEWRIVDCRFIEDLDGEVRAGNASALYINEEIDEAKLTLIGCEFVGTRDDLPAIRTYGGVDLTLQHCTVDSPWVLFVKANYFDVSLLLESNLLISDGTALDVRTSVIPMAFPESDWFEDLPTIEAKTAVGSNTDLKDSLEELGLSVDTECTVRWLSETVLEFNDPDHKDHPGYGLTVRIVNDPEQSDEQDATVKDVELSVAVRGTGNRIEGAINEDLDYSWAIDQASYVNELARIVGSLRIPDGVGVALELEADEKLDLDLNYNTYHVEADSGSGLQLQTLTVGGSEGTTKLFYGPIHLIGDGNWSLGEDANIVPKNGTTDARSITLIYDPLTELWYEL